MRIRLESEFDEHGPQLTSDESAGADVVDVISGTDRFAAAQNGSREVALERSELRTETEPDGVGGADHRNVGETQPTIDDFVRTGQITDEHVAQGIGDAEAHGRRGEPTAVPRVRSPRR